MRYAVALLFLAGALAAQTPKPEPKGAIRGVVKDSTGTPLADIAVTALASRLELAPNGRVAVGRTVTDEMGSYALTGLPAATYTVSTDRIRATNASRQVHLDSDQEITVDLTIPADPAISGRVLNENKEPAVDAFVWLLKAEYQAGVLKQTIVGPQITGEDGRYAFETGVEANRKYSILADISPPDEVVASLPEVKDRKPIEVPTYYPAATRLESAAPVSLQPGEHRDQVDIKITTAGFYCAEGKIQISGKPSSSSFAIHERPLAGSRLVRLRGSSGADGKFHVCGLSPGQYRLSTDGGFTDFTVGNSDLQHVDLSVDTATPRLRVDWDGDPPTPQEPNLDAGTLARLRNLANTLGRGDLSSDADLKQFAKDLGRDAGKVDADTAAMLAYLTGRSAAQLGGVYITLTGAGGGTATYPSVRIPFDGPLAPSVAAGDYTIEVHTSGLTDPYVKEVTYNDLKLADGALGIAPASSGTLHVLVGHGASVLNVHVADSEGKPVPDATIILLPDSVTTVPLLSRLADRGQTDQNGSFRSPPLPPGKYRILASAQSVRWDVPEDLEKVLLLMFQAKEVELSANAMLTMSLEPVQIF